MGTPVKRVEVYVQCVRLQGRRDDDAVSEEIAVNYLRLEGYVHPLWVDVVGRCRGARLNTQLVKRRILDESNQQAGQGSHLPRQHF